jgi:aspartyl-tRNA(Asn)/glutamyl-tRNA(Gln) amidotransferase subunit A
MSDPICRPISELAPALRGGTLSSCSLTENALARIAALDSKLGSFACVADDAQTQAAAMDAELRDGKWRGPLHGVPIAVKDNYLTADMPSRAGSNAPAICFPKRDAATVARLREAGAIIIGKTRMHEFAWGTVTPDSKNPWDLTRVPGGSSGGSGAAVSAGIVPAALGSDTGGSIRIPASLCGTVGLSPLLDASAVPASCRIAGRLIMPDRYPILLPIAPMSSM